MTCKGHFCPKKDTSVINFFSNSGMSISCFEKDSSVNAKVSSVHQLGFFQNGNFIEKTSLSHIAAQLSTIPTTAIV